MTIIITDEDVKRLLPMKDCIEAMRVAFRDLSTGSAVNRPRMRYVAEHPDPDRKYFANIHVGAVPSYGVACVRAGSHIIRPPSETVTRRMYENPQPFNSGIVLLYCIETAQLIAMLHEFHISGMRVAATSAVAVDHIARPDAVTLGLFGTGKQAHTAVEALALVRPFRRVNVFSPSVEHREAFAREMSRPGLDVVAVDDARAVLDGADVICCATSSLKPVFDGDWLEDGQFVITIANSDITNRNKRSEVDLRTYERAKHVIVTDWESVLGSDQREILDPLAEGTVRQEQIHELKDIVAGKVQVKQPPRGDKADKIIYYKNNAGIAIQFAAAGGLTYRRAIAEGNNKVIPSDWLGTDLSAFYKAGFRPSP
jgi:ornithine cyclodeaminase/alanine dehydrogenase-like protein (mu-crystallin family)